MSAEAIAKVVADLRAGRARDCAEDGVGGLAARLAKMPSTTVDATAIYRQVVEKDEIAVYEDHPCIAPPFNRADVAYVNVHGNVIVMDYVAIDHSRETEPALKLDTMQVMSRMKGWETDNPVDWDRVRWTIDTFVWVGGRNGQGDALRSAGPVTMWRFAVYEDGEPADLHWVQLLEDVSMTVWDTAHLVLLGTLNFMNCRNVESVEPKRPRAEARRIARTGVTVHELTVYPTSKTSRSGQSTGLGVPLSSVRGHPAHYGDCCPGRHDAKGKLFGRLEGRFWIPQHARGTADLGEHRNDYKVSVG